MNNFNKLQIEGKKLADNENPFSPISLFDLYNIKFPDNKWAIEKLIPCQGITLISGAPASYKTWILLRMALDIAKGEDFLGEFKCEQSNVLIIDEENHLRLVRDRFKALETDITLPIYYLSQKDFLISKKDMIHHVLNICEEKKIGVIFIDSLVRINQADENDASQMSEVFRGIKQFCQNRITVIITHHERKDGRSSSSAQNRLRGSSDIQASVDCHLAIRRDANDKTRISIEQAKLRTDEEMGPFDVFVKKNGASTEFIYIGTRTEDKSKKELAIELIPSIIMDAPEGLSTSGIFQNIKESLQIGDKNIREAIRELVDNEVIIEKQGQRNTKIYFYNNLSLGETSINKPLV